MADFVIFPIHRTWRTVSSLSEYVVDIVEDNGVVRRGYVCDTSEHGLQVKVGSGRQTILVPFDHLRMPNDKMGTITNNTPPDMEVLIGFNTDYEIWQRAKLISFCKCADSSYYGDPTYAYTLLYISMNGCEAVTAHTRCILIDGDARITQRARGRGKPSSKITADTFYKLVAPMPEPTQECPDPASSLKRAVALPRFHEYWLSSTYTLFVVSNVDHVEVLRPSDPKLTLAAESSEKDYYRRLVTRFMLSPISAFLERFEQVCSAAVINMMNDMVSAVMHLNDDDANDPHYQYQNLPVVIHLQILSYLDVYDQTLLNRTSKFLKPLLDTSYLKRSAFIPADAAYDLESLEGATYKREKGSFALLHVILRGVTRNVKVLYLIGNWINCLLPLTCLLRLMSLKLDWLVIAQNSVLQINEFQSFPRPHCTLSDHLPIPSYWDVCRNVALKDVSFSSKNSICFSYHGNCRLFPSIRNCCIVPFLIPINRWSVNLNEFEIPAEKKWNASVRLMFHNFCSKMSNEEIVTLMDWLTRTEMVKNRMLWTCVCWCFSLWGVEPPGDVGSLKCIVYDNSYRFANQPKQDPDAVLRLRCALSRDFPEKNIIMRTLALLIPRAQCGQ